MARVRPLVLAVAWLVASRAGAQSAPEVVDAARAHFQAGQVYYNQGDFRRALKEFHEAARDADRPGLDYNLGRTYDRLGDAAHAVQSYRRYLARLPAVENRAAIEERLTALAPLVGSLHIVTQVAGASFQIDGEPIAATELGAPIAITAGPHRVAAAASGFLTREADVVVAGGRESTLALDPAAPRNEPQAPRASRWWIGVLVGAVLAVVAAGGVALAFALRGTEAPAAGNLAPGVQAAP